MCLAHGEAEHARRGAKATKARGPRQAGGRHGRRPEAGRSQKNKKEKTKRNARVTLYYDDVDTVMYDSAAGVPHHDLLRCMFLLWGYILLTYFDVDISRL